MNALMQISFTFQPTRAYTIDQKAVAAGLVLAAP
jgi:hypothetical protein